MRNPARARFCRAQRRVIITGVQRSRDAFLRTPAGVAAARQRVIAAVFHFCRLPWNTIALFQSAQYANATRDVPVGV